MSFYSDRKYWIYHCTVVSDETIPDKITVFDERLLKILSKICKGDVIFIIKNNILLARGVVTDECVIASEVEGGYKRKLNIFDVTNVEIPLYARSKIPMLTICNIADMDIVKQFNDVFDQKELVNPCDGNQPYIFISYAHKDSLYVMPIIVALQKNGCPVWYDAGIQVGSEWPEIIAEKLAGSSLVIAFVSSNYVASQNCRQEITYALNKAKEVLTIRLDNSEMTPGLEMQLGLSQNLNAYLHKSQEEYVKLLIESPLIQELKNK